MMLQIGRMVFPKLGTCRRHCGIGYITRRSGANDFGPHRGVPRNRPRGRPCENKLELEAPVTRLAATSGRRKSGVVRKTDIRSDVRDAVQLLLLAPCPPATPFFTVNTELLCLAALGRRRHLAEADQLARTPTKRTVRKASAKSDTAHSTPSPSGANSSTKAP